MAALQNGTFYGRAAPPLRIDDVVLAETSYDAGFVVPVHAHASPFFCVPLRGSFVEQVDRSHRVLRPRAAFFHPPGHDHAETFETAARLFNIQLGDAWLRQLTAYDTVLPDHHVALPDGRLPRLGLELHDEYRAGGDRLIVEGLLLAMIGEVARFRGSARERVQPLWLRAVVACINESFPAVPSIAHLTRIAGVHPAHLARTFRNVHGCTIGEYARGLRITRARELLSGTDLSLSRIAHRCGFADQSHFGRVFRRVVGVTPAAYRRGSRGG